MTNFTIRPATLSDIPEITEIYAHHVKTRLESFEETPPNEAEMAERMATIFAQNCPYLVAMQNGQVAGYAYAGLFAKRIAYRFVVEDSIYLDEHATGQGIGQALLERLMEECTLRGFRQMIAIITRLDPPVSYNLHKKLGFKDCGTLEHVGYKHDTWLDVIYMQRALGPQQD